MSKDSTLFKAIIQDDEKSVRNAIQQGANVNCICLSELEMRPLHFAAKYGKLEIVKSLIDGGADVNAQTVLGETPANIAEELGFADCLNAILQNDAKSKPLLELENVDPRLFNMTGEKRSYVMLESDSGKRARFFSADLVECPVCFEDKECEALAPCGHFLCSECLSHVDICAKCREPIIASIKKLYR